MSSIARNVPTVGLSWRKRGGLYCCEGRDEGRHGMMPTGGVGDRCSRGCARLGEVSSSTLTLDTKGRLTGYYITKNLWL